jgi:hypothetical protein
VNAHTGLCYSSDAVIKVSGHDPLWNYTNVLPSIDLPLKQFLCCLSRDQATSIIFVGLKKSIPLTCVVSFPLTLIVTARIEVPFTSFV